MISSAIFRARTLQGIVTSAATLSLTLVPAITGSGAHAATAKTVAFFAASPLPAAGNVAVTRLPASARAQLIPGQASVAPKLSTPNGYKLRGGDVTDKGRHYYKSANVWAIEASCGSTCKIVQQVKLSLKENVLGVTSKGWWLTEYATHWSGPSTFHTSWYYECGVNLAGKGDETCSTWRHDGAQGGDSGPGHNGEVVKKYFGTTNNVTKFPMLKLDVTFADGSHSTGDDGQRGEKFRGWDVCVTAKTTKLCKKTGKG